MPKQDIIVVGASAGGVDALKVLAAGLPAGLEAAVFVALHIGNGINGKSFLPDILSKAGPLPAVRAKDGEKIRKGTIYVAPPDYHLLLKPERLHLSHGPKENRTRPAINPLFRSAAFAYAGRVTGVILTGMLDDGVAGLAEIKRQGGVAVVQDPDTAFCSSMPDNALQRVEVDYVAPLPKIAALVSDLANKERRVIERDEPMERTPSDLTCPECGGPLWEERQGKIVEFRCRVGHVYTPVDMEQEHHDVVERSLWSAVVALEEAADIAEKLAPELGAKSLDEARKKCEHAAVLKRVLNCSPA
ncbi:MAG TPA: chemotaxis protein CheB [Bryobacteraceae bacterium]|nr:chemotaxis protein CheB [Bryobacteraceae bacterium]